ncbi:WXG100 family type VII secretion target [Mycolicibacterium sp.]|uniref:WXG100 family type VII secretion target n=1 Tax=Mycolicibacterium sp. TaxID=2320850 RepID=UPI0037CA2445
MGSNQERRLEVDRDKLGSIVDQMEALTQKVERSTDLIERIVASLHIDWSGAAARAHEEAHREWDAGAREMRDALTDLHEMGHVAHSNYNSAADTNLKMWRR